MADPKIRYDIGATVTGDAEINKLASELEKLDSSLDPALAERARLTAQRIRELGEQQAAVTRFVELKQASEQAAAALDKAQTEAQAFASKLSALGVPTRTQAGQLEKLKDAVKATATEHEKQTAALDKSRAALTAAGIPIEGLAQKQAELRRAVASSVDEFKQLGTQAGATNSFAKLAADTEDARIAVTKSQAALIAFGNTLSTTEAPTRAQALRLAELAAAADKSQQALKDASTSQAAAAGEMRRAGVDVERVATAQARARSETLLTAQASRDAAIAAGQQGRAFQAAATQQVQAAGSVQAGIKGIGDQLRTIQSLAAAALGGQLLSGTLGDVTRTADAYENLAARIRLVTGEGAAFDAAFQGVFDVATRTSSALESTGTLFARIAQAGRDIGVSNQQALALTETINQAVQVSGASAASSDAALTQLIQGLQSGVLRGEEFNSVMEQAPRLATALADGLGVPIGQLRRLAETGQLTSTTVIQALRSQSEAVAKEFGALPATVGRAITNLSTEWTRFIGITNGSTGATTVIADGINLLAGNLDNVAAVASRAGAVLVAALAVQGAQALRTFVIEGRAATVTATALSASLSTIPKVISITVAAAGFEIGFQIGEMLRENSALARQLGVAIAGFMQATVSDLQLLAESAAAIFNDDTIGAAVDRYKARAAELDDSFRVLWAEAENAPGRVADAADQAGAATQAMGDQARATGSQIASAAGSAAGGVASIGSGAVTAMSAIQALGQAAGVSLPGIGASAAQSAKALLDVVVNGGKAADVFARDLPAALSKLSGAELQAFGAAMKTTLEQTIRDSQRLAAELQAAGRDGSAALAKADAAAAQLALTLQQTGKQALASLGVDVASVSNRLTTEFAKSSAELTTVISTLPQLKAAGIDTGTAVAQALGNMVNQAQNQADLDAVRARIEALGTAGTIAGPQVAGALQMAADKAVEIRQKIEDATPGIQGLDEALRRAGTSAEELQTGFSRAATSAINDVDSLITSLDNLGIEGDIAGRALSTSLNKAVETANTERAVQAVIDRFNALGQQGLLTGDQLAEGLDKAQAKLASLTPGVQGLDEALRAFGLKSQSQLQQTADNFSSAWEQIRNSTTVGLNDKIKAFEQYKAAAIAANGGVTSGQIQLQEEILRTRAAAEGMPESFRTAGDSGEREMRRVADSTSGAADQLERLQRLQQIREPSPDRRVGVVTKNPDGTITDSAGVRRNPKTGNDVNTYSSSVSFGALGDLKAKRDAGTLTAADLEAAQAAMLEVQKGGAFLSSLAKQSAGSVSSAAVNSQNASESAAKQILEYVTALASAKAAPAPTQRQTITTDANGQRVTTPANTASSTTHTVNININGSTRTIAAASEGDAARLKAVLQELAAAKSVAQ